MLDSEPMPRPKVNVTHVTDPEEALRLLKEGLENMKKLQAKEREAAK